MNNTICHIHFQTVILFFVIIIRRKVSCSLLDWDDPRRPIVDNVSSRRRKRFSILKQFTNYDDTIVDEYWMTLSSSKTETRNNRKYFAVDLEYPELHYEVKDAFTKNYHHPNQQQQQQQQSRNQFFSIRNILSEQNNERKTTMMEEYDYLTGRGGVDVGDGNDDVTKTVQLVNRVKMWPPWPLNLLTSGSRNNNNDRNDDDDDPDNAPVTAKNYYPSAAALFWSYFRQRTRIGVRQLQEVGSQLWFNLPPAAPPLILLASIPRQNIIENVEAGVSLSQRFVPIISNSFARNLVLAGLGLSVMSWAHVEVHRKKQLTPLNFPVPYRSVSRAFLPPFLPEVVPEPEIEALQSAEESVEKDEEGIEGNTSNSTDSVASLVSPRLRKHLNHLYESATPRTFQATFREWGRMRSARRREAAKVRRLSIFDELVALQALKRKAVQYQKKKKQGRMGTTKDGKSTDPISSSDIQGYALVTGASQGIGRAIAVELARWEIPLILVARDVDRLTALAYDLEACYGVKCCVLKADLAQANAAESIYNTTRDAGLTIDILVNNAGFAHDGLAVDMDIDEVERMVVVNAMSYAKLSKLYGQDMKNKRRGRLLFVSSMAGLTSASPNSALYGATKAFAKSLAFSLSKEMEPFGVGVTCLMPGAVKNTEFRSRSGSGQALCWYLPFYARPANVVAHLGITSLLDGDLQCIPGWQNRMFVNMFLPIIPTRVEVMAVHLAWTPIKFPVPRFFWGKQQNDKDNNTKNKNEIDKHQGIQDDDPPSKKPLPDLKPRYTLQPPPRLLKLPEPPKIIVEEQQLHDPNVTNVEDGGTSEEESDTTNEDAPEETLSIHSGTSDVNDIRNKKYDNNDKQAESVTKNESDLGREHEEWVISSAAH